MSYPILFAPGTTNFSGVGIGVLRDAIECKVREVLNGEFELSMTYPVEGELFHSICKEAVIAVKMRDRNDYQGFRIFSISKPLDKNVTIEAEHVSYKLAEIPLKNFSAGGIQEVLAAFSSHVVEGVTNPFTFTTNFINSSAPELITTIPVTIKDVMGDDDGMMLSKDEWKNGEWKFDNWTISFLQNRGIDKSASICYQYGSNVASFNQDEDLSNTVTAVFPYWHTDYTDPDSEAGAQVPVNVYGAVQYASGHAQFANERIAIVNVDEYFTDEEKEAWEPDAAGVKKPTAAAVSAKGLEALNNSDNVCKPHVSLTVDPVELSSLVEYSDISKEFEQVNLGDTVSVHFADYDIDTQEKIIEIEYDVLRDINSSVTIGDPTPNLASTIADIGKAIEENRAGMVVTRDSLLLYVKTEAGDLATQIEMTEDRIYQKVSGNPSGWNMVPITGDASATGGEGIDISFYNYGDPDSHYEPGQVYNNQYYFDDETGAVWKCVLNTTTQEYEWVQPRWTRDHGKVARGTDTAMQAAADLEHYMFNWYNTTDDIIYVCERYADGTAPGGYVYYWTAKEEGPDGDTHIQLTGELMYAERADIYSYSEIESQANQIVLKVNSAGHMVQVALAARAGLGSEFNVKADNINFDSYTFNLATDRININSPGFKVTPAGYMTANDGQILGDFEVDGAFFLINEDELDELISYGVFDQTGFTIYKPCDENDVGAVELLRKDGESMYYNQKVVMSIDETGAGWSMEDRSTNAITRLRGNNLCVSQIYTNNWAPKEDAYVDDGSAFEGFKAWLSMNPRWFGMYHKVNGGGSQLNDYRLGHFFGEDVSDTVELIDEWWDGDSNPKNPDEAMFLMESPTDKNNNFLMAVYDQIIMAGGQYTSKQSPRMFRIRSKLDPSINSVMRYNNIGISDYFYKKSPFQINSSPMYTLTNDGSGIVTGDNGTNLADGCFIIVYDGPARDKETITLTIYGGMDDTITIKDLEDTTIDTLTFAAGTSVGVLETQDLDKFSTYRFKSAVYNFTIEHTIAKANDEVEVIPASVKWIRVADFPNPCTVPISKNSAVYNGLIYTICGNNERYNNKLYNDPALGATCPVFTFDSVSWSSATGIPTTANSVNPNSWLMSYGNNTMIVYNGKLYVFIKDYASGSSTVYNEYWVFDGTTWTKLTTDIQGTSFPNRVWDTFVKDGLLYMVTGDYDGRSLYLWSYDSVNNRIAQVKNPLFSFNKSSGFEAMANGYRRCIVLNNVVHMFFWYQIDYYSANYSAHYIYDTDAGTLTQLNNLPWLGDYNMRSDGKGMCIYKGKIHVFGNTYNTHYIYNEATDTWTKSDDIPWGGAGDSAERYIRPVVYKDNLYLIGTNNRSLTSDATTDYVYKYRYSEPS